MKATTVTARRRRRWLWRVICLLLGPAALLLAEAALRVADYAPPPALFIPARAAGESDLFHTNLDYPAPFFFATYRNLRVPHGEPIDVHFRIPKPDRTVRVVFIGASTAEGFPHAPGLASSAFLDAMLEDMMPPDRDIEVINLGMSALASFPLIQIARDSLAAAPDLAVVYAGQNEFYGAYGVASLQSAVTGRWGMKIHAGMRRTRLFQAVQSLVSDVGKKPTAEDLIGIMAATIFDRPDDWRYAQAAENLEGNLAEIYGIYRNAGVPVVGCTLVVNEQGVAPFASAQPEVYLSSEQQERFKNLVVQAETARQDNPDAAAMAWSEALRIFPRHALTEYRLAELKLATGDTVEARKWFQAAVRDDCMPWRAGPAANKAVRAAATAGGVVLADLDRGFHDALDGAAIGWSLMSDHLHPSPTGQALMAQIIARTIATESMLEGLSNTSVSRLRSLDAYRSALGDDPLIELATCIRVAKFMESSPLGRNNQDAIRARHNRATVMRDRLDPIARWVVETCVNAEFPRNIARIVAEEHAREGNQEAAEHYYRIAMLSADPYTFERLEGLTGWLVTRRHRAQPIEANEIDAAIRFGLIVLATTRRAGGDLFMAKLWALAGEETHALEHARRNARGLTETAKRRIEQEIRALLGAAE